MTLIQPEPSLARMTYALWALGVALAIVASSLIAMYAGVVDLRHDMAAAREDIQALETESASLRDNMYALLEPASQDALVAARGLVADRSPRYITIDQEWSLVSRY